MKVMPQGAVLIECPEVGHAFCSDALQVDHEATVASSAYGRTVLTSTSDINGAGRRRSSTVQQERHSRVAPRPCRGAIELLKRMSSHHGAPYRGRLGAVDGRSTMTNADNYGPPATWADMLRLA